MNNDLPQKSKPDLFLIICIIITVLYVISPVDALPDTIPFLGQLDDLLAVGITAIIGYIRSRKRKRKREELIEKSEARRQNPEYESTKLPD
jgi:uncharacterized membrane protein YkvA (DUF1232 family)